MTRLDATTMYQKPWTNNIALAWFEYDTSGAISAPNDFEFEAATNTARRGGRDVYQTHIIFPSVVNDEFIWDVGDNTIGAYVGTRAPHFIRIRAGNAAVAYDYSSPNNTAFAVGCQGSIFPFMDGRAHDLTWFVQATQPARAVRCHVLVKKMTKH